MRVGFLKSAPLTALAMAVTIAAPFASPADTITTSTTTSDATAPVAIEGEVFTTGADVTVEVSAVVWPDQDTLDRLPVDGRVPLLRVPTIDVSNSRFSVRIDPALIPASHRASTGVDIEITATPSSGDMAVYNETLTTDGSAWIRSRAATGEAEQVARGRTPSQLPVSERAELPAALVVGPGAQERNKATALAPAMRVAAPRAALNEELMLAAEPVCDVYKTSNTHDHRAKISDVMPSATYMKGKVSYKIGTSHSLGVGVKTYSGALSESGTITRSSDESVDPIFRVENHTARTTWRYRDYKNSCTQNITARPESHEGGYYVPQRDHPSYSYCKYYAPMTWSTTDATAWTYQSGVTLWGALNVNAQTGYSSDVKVSYQFLDRGKYLCGNNANPPSAKLVAGK